MAYETTYSSSLADQQDLIDKYLQMDEEVSNESNFDVDYMDNETNLEDEVQDDYEMYKSFYEENQAKIELDDNDEDLSFLDFVFSGENKYKSFQPQTSGTAGINTGFSGYAGQASGSLKDNISKLESGGNYKAFNPGGGGKGAVGKYQFRWNIHKGDIAKQTGITNEKDFMNSPKAQEKYFDYWDQTTLTPSAKANYNKFKQYYPNATEDDVKRATHFAGRGNLEKALKTGNFTKPLDANKTSIQKYVFKN